MIIIVAALTATICFLVFKNTNAQISYPEKITLPKIIVKEKQDIQLLFVGDLMFDRGIRYYANLNGGNDYIFDKIHSTLLQNDLVIANLEGPITDNKSISSGTIPGSTNNYYFTFDKSVANTLFNQNIKLVNLGNNHILNFDYQGLKSTEEYLTKANVDYFGAPGSNNSSIQDISGVKVAFISYDQFNLSQPEEVIAKIAKLKLESDIVIIFSHWGEEYQLTQSENQTELAHQFIDAGADLIIGSHPHVIQPIEEYIGPDGFVDKYLWNQHLRLRWDSGETT